MPIDKTTNQPDGADSQGPKPPTNPVEFARWVQRPRVDPKKPKVQPDDSALLPEPLEKPGHQGMTVGSFKTFPSEYPFP